MNRRTFLKTAGLGGLLSLAQTAPVGAGMFFAKRLFSVPARRTLPITPNDKFYVVNISEPSFVQQPLDVRQWRLKITGQVKRPLTVTYDEILRRPSLERPQTLTCIENTVLDNSIGNAVWRGVRLRDLLEEAGADREAAVKIVFRCADGYSDSIAAERGWTGDVVLAYLMNGEPLPREHGYPIRALVPGLYGIKNPKWILEIEVSNFDYKGYWQQRGWTDDGAIKIISRIDSPGHYAELEAGQAHLLRGIAFSGSAGIGKVEVSTDNQKTWRPARLDPPMGPYSWILWEFPWRPTRGTYTVSVRAWDLKGRVQSAQNIRPYPDGPEGLHTIILDAA